MSERLGLRFSRYDGKEGADELFIFYRANERKGVIYISEVTCLATAFAVIVKPFPFILLLHSVESAKCPRIRP